MASKTRDLSTTSRLKRGLEELLLAHAADKAQSGIGLLESPGESMTSRKWMYANDAACSMMHTTRAKLMKSGSTDFFFGDDKIALSRCIQALIRGEVWIDERHAFLPDVTRRWVKLSIRPIQMDGKHTDHLVLSFTDIDGKKKSFARSVLLTSLLEQSSDLLVATDGEKPASGGGRIIYANPSFAAFVGSSAEQLIGMPLVSFLSPENDPRIAEHIRAGLEKNTFIAKEVLIRRLDDHTDHLISFTGSTFTTKDGLPNVRLFAGLDIGNKRAQQQMAAQLVTALDLAEEAITIYRMYDDTSMAIEYANQHSIDQGDGLLLRMRENAMTWKRAETAIGSLKKDSSRFLLVNSAEGNGNSSWISLELREVEVTDGAARSIIATEHRIFRVSPGGGQSLIPIAPRLADELLSYSSFSGREDAICETARVLWNCRVVFTTAKARAGRALTVGDHSASIVVPTNRLGKKAVAIAMSWKHPLKPDQITEISGFLEHLAAK